MSPTSSVLFFLIAFSINAASAFASEKPDCSVLSYSEVRSLAELPAEVRTLLRKDAHDYEGIADRDEQFNITDDLGPGDEKLPFRRFSLAAVGTDNILVAVEHGGRGYNVELWIFEPSRNGWSGAQRQVMFNVPTTLQELVSNLNACNSK